MPVSSFGTHFVVSPLLLGDLTILRGGGWPSHLILPQAYVYPPEMRATRDLLRRRLHLVRRRGNLLAHIQNTHHQYNRDVPSKKVGKIHDIQRFPRVQDFLSYARLVKCEHSSAGKRLGRGGAKIGNVHPKWAFSEAAALFLRNNPEGQRHLRRLAGRHGKAKALSILAAKLGRAVYLLLSKERVFEMQRFLATS